MKTSWKKNEGGQTHYCHVGPRRVEVGSHHGSGHSDNASTCSHQEFLQGRFHNIIRDAFGARVLSNVIKAVKGIVLLPEVIEQLETEKKQLENWRKMPVNQSLKQLALDADEDGHDNYANGPRRSTVVYLNADVKLVVHQPPTRSYLLYSDKTRKHVKLWPGSLIGHGGFAYLVALHLYVYDVNGDCKFSTESLTRTHGIGRRFPVRNVLRKGDTILAVYENHALWDDPSTGEVLGRDGLLEVDKEKGIVGWCIRQAP
jgi:hypothetical protein